MQQLDGVVKELSVFDPLYVSVTYGAGGTTRKRARETLFRLKETTSLTLMSHLTCIGATRQSMKSLLDEYEAQGIDNILALRGDPPPDATDFDPARGEFPYAKDLVDFICPFGTFSVAVAVYPEMHVQSPSREKDIEYTKRKIDAGADFGITQMFFDNRYFYEFMDHAAKVGITIPILPGIMPITDLPKIRTFAAFCGATIPGWIDDRIDPVADKPEELRKIGIDLAVEQCRDLLDNGVRYLHFYTMNQSHAVGTIVKTPAGRFD